MAHSVLVKCKQSPSQASRPIQCRWSPFS